VTLVFLGAPAGIFDFDSFSFHDPTFGSDAQHVIESARQTARPRQIFLMFMALSLSWLI
jgi:hypothetical protein